jgi:hypothetical protein
MKWRPGNRPPIGVRQELAVKLKPEGLLIMKIKTSVIATLSLVLVVSCLSQAHDKKKQSQRGMLESMQSVPCGAKEREIFPA